MTIGPHAQAVLLLTAHFGKAAGSEPRPLSAAEWRRLAHWLEDHAIAPEALLLELPADALTGWMDRTVSLDRLRCLLDRGAAMALAIEKWERAGLWILTRADAGYPERIEQLLGHDSPPVFFGCGSRKLLGQRALAVVGSRDATEDDLAFAASIGEMAALQGFSIVSGGARGIDEAVMSGALDHEGTAIGILADSLLRAATSARWRAHLLSRNLVLISPFNPEAGFDVGNAMARNRYIYCLSQAGVVVSSKRGQGGTWAGAIENLKQGWVPLWARRVSDVQSGNAELMRRGARPLPEGDLEIDALHAAGDRPVRRAAAQGLFERPQSRPGLDGEPSGARSPSHGTQDKTDGNDGDRPPLPDQPPASQMSFDVFVHRLRALTVDKPLSRSELLAELGIGNRRLSAWLKQAVQEGHVIRRSRPVRYQWRAARPRQASMFGED